MNLSSLPGTSANMARKRTFRCSSYTAEAMLLAYQSVKLGIYTGRKAAAEFNVPYGTLNKKLSGRAPVEAHGAGRPIEISIKNEEKFAEYLFISGRYGYGYSKCEIKDLVAEFVREEEIKTRWADGKPGYEWLKNFLKRHPEVNVRRDEHISHKRLDGIDPFFVFKFYTDLEVLFDHEKLSLPDAHRIYNVAEISFKDVRQPIIIPSKCSSCISKTVRSSIELGASAVVCIGADGKKLHPLIVFQGRCVLPPHIVNKNFPKMSYYTTSSRKWKDGALFSYWFENVFIPQIPNLVARQGRSIILLFNGSSLHINIQSLSLAVKHNIIFVKIPPNLINILQPLNKMCLSVLESTWSDQLFYQNHLNLATIQKLFGQLFGIIWSKHFRKLIVRKAFRTTGVFPPDRNQFPAKVISKSALKRYFEKSQQLVKDTLKIEESESPSASAYDLDEAENSDPIYDVSNFPDITDEGISSNPFHRIVLKKRSSSAILNTTTEPNTKRKKIVNELEEEGFGTEVKQVIEIAKQL
ncbi:DDE-1 domain-containing protein [Nephila pilipes]|uniref:DDE-1 domain-containing protein n=1 Tax=Nephila pilipes TaxID=299642 RepID=A0A8X6PUT2_NEPPI|nr:DDE-1 domain-containing protein [Nephila pilipes]